MAADLTYPQHKIMPVVIYAHGINGFKDWGGMDLVAELFAKQGLAFLKFNFSKNGTTPENQIEFVDLEAYGNDNYLTRHNDLKQVIDFIMNREDLEFEINGIYLLGHSRGGTDAILYTPTDTRINKLVTWAAPGEARTPWGKWTDDEMEYWHKTGVKYLANSRTGQELPIYYQLYNEHKNSRQLLNVERSARMIEIPWLIAHGEEDESVFIKSAYDLKDWQPHAQTLIVKGAGHTFGRKHPWVEKSLPKASKELVKTTIDFLKEKGGLHH